MEIDKLAVNEGPAIYYRDSFHAVIEDHLAFLRSHEDTTIMDLQPNEAYRWTADLFGFLNSKGVPSYLHWTVMRMNGMTSPTEMDENVRTLMVPSVKIMTTLVNIQRVKAT